MSSLILNPKFLLDENVRIELSRFLISKDFDIILAPKSAKDTTLAQLSFKQKYILVTNDEDFCNYSKDKVFAVVWLRIPQNDPKGLLDAFEKLISECKNYTGRLVILEINKWTSSPLSKNILIV